MAKKTTEKDVLIVRDEKTGEISVVAGLNADGSPKRTPAKAENAQSFLQFDRHGDVLDNFFKNFFRQCKEPSRFGFYRVAADQADKLMEVMKDLLKDPEANKELLAPHKVDTSGYEKQVKKEQTAGMPEQKQEGQPKETQKQEEMEKKQEQNQENPQQAQSNRGYQPIDESKINWKELEEKWGVKRDDLEKSGDLDRACRGVPGDRRGRSQPRAHRARGGARARRLHPPPPAARRGRSARRLRRHGGNAPLRRHRFAGIDVYDRQARRTYDPGAFLLVPVHLGAGQAESARSCQGAHRLLRAAHRGGRAVHAHPDRDPRQVPRGIFHAHHAPVYDAHRAGGRRPKRRQGARHGRKSRSGRLADDGSARLHRGRHASARAAPPHRL